MLGGLAFWSCKKLCPPKVDKLTYSKSRPKLRIVRALAHTLAPIGNFWLPQSLRCYCPPAMSIIWVRS
jgi:hypothetical protein